MGRAELRAGHGPLRWSRGALHLQWWLSWHVNAVLALFTAVPGPLLFGVWRALVAPDASGPMPQRGTWACWLPRC